LIYTSNIVILTLLELRRTKGRVEDLVGGGELVISQVQIDRLVVRC
jgi:hypothetical protein